MDTKLDLLKELKSSPLTKTGTSFSNLSDAIEYREFEPSKLFVAHFNMLPNLIGDRDIDCIKANEWFVKMFKEEIKDYYFKKVHLKGTQESEYKDCFYFVYDDLIVNFDVEESLVRLLYKTTELAKVQALAGKLKAFKKLNKKSEISLIVNSSLGLNTQEFEVTKPRLSLRDNYNDDFMFVHKTILKRLSKNNDKGLILLHGLPGTGKTSYIRYLVASVEKKVVFLPTNLAGSVTNVNLISLLIENPNSIFVIEDAENIIMDRNKDENSPVSALLNISDGLLSDCLNIQIICSFNTNLSKIDKALLRKGRLIAKYEFKPLTKEKAQALSNRLGFTKIIEGPQTLTDIYNQDELDTLEENKTSIGFKSRLLNA